MKRKELMRKMTVLAISGMLAANGMGLQTFAASGSEIAKDGTYSAIAHAARTVEDDEDENEWDEYDVKVTLNVKDGVFSEISVDGINGYDESTNGSYFRKAAAAKKSIAALLTGQPATEETVESWDIVSGATRTSKAVKAAALEAIQNAPTVSEQNPDEEDKTKSDADNTGSSPDTEPKKDTDDTGKNEENPEKDNQETDKDNPDTGKDTDESDTDMEEDVTYVLMNIPYAQFYAADVNNEVQVDAFTSATKNKVRTGSLSGGSYHVDASGDEITGITFPVKLVGDVDLSSYSQVTDEDLLEITTTNRGMTSTTVYSGAAALYERPSYSYYVLSEKPDYYKEVSADNGGLVFGSVQGNAVTLDNVDAQLSTASVYGDYQLSLDGLTEVIPTSENVYAVIIHTAQGNDYGLRHLENIWRVSELAWSTGFTETVHNCPTSSAHYKDMMGQTITGVTYYAASGIYEIPVDDIYVPIKTGAVLSVEDALLSSGSTKGLVKLPADYDAWVTITAASGEDVTEQFSVSAAEDGFVFDFDANEVNGRYTVTISDTSEKYADITSTMMLIDDEIPVAYNNDNKAPALITADDSTEEKSADFIKNIASVNVNGRSYAASGRGAVVLFDQNGNLDTSSSVFAEEVSYEITVTSVGYQDYTFTFTKKASETDTDDIKDTDTDDTKGTDTDNTKETDDPKDNDTNDTKGTDDPKNTGSETVVNTEALSALIAKAEGLELSGYSNASRTVLEKVLAGAKKILTDPVSQKDVDAAAAALTQALDDLQKTDSAAAVNTGKTSVDNANDNNKGTVSGSAAKSVSASASNAATAPKTGDVSIVGSISAMIAAAAILAGTLLFRRKKERNDSAVK